MKDGFSIKVVPRSEGLNLNNDELSPLVACVDPIANDFTDPYVNSSPIALFKND